MIVFPVLSGRMGLCWVEEQLARTMIRASANNKPDPMLRMVMFNLPTVLLISVILIILFFFLTILSHHGLDRLLVAHFLGLVSLLVIL